MIRIGRIALLVIAAGCGGSGGGNGLPSRWFDLEQPTSLLHVKNNTQFTISTLVISDPAGFGDLYRIDFSLAPGGEWTSPPLPCGLSSVIGFVSEPGFVTSNDPAVSLLSNTLVLPGPTCTESFLTLEASDFAGTAGQWDIMFPLDWRPLFTQQELLHIFENAGF